MLVSELIEETRRLIFGGQREERNKLTSIIVDSATSLTVTYPLGQITRGTKLSIDLEDIYVWDATGTTVSPIDRGQFGSAASNHANGAIIHVNPKFSNWDIFNAINDEIVSLSSPANGLFRTYTQEITYNPVIHGYSFVPNDLLSILEVRYGTYGPSLEYQMSSDWDYSPNLSDEFPSGSAIFIRDAVPGRQVLITGKYSFLQLNASPSIDLATTGVPTTAYDILSIGAAWRLTSSMEVSRNFTSGQGDTRRANEVPPGSQLGASRELGRLREIRIREEASRLSEKYPARSPRFPYKASYA